MSNVFTDQNFDSEVLKSDQVTMVDFWAPWCGPCQMMGPVVEELAKDLEGQVKIGKLNVDENPAMAQRYNVMSIPTFLIFKNGEKVGEELGGMPKEKLKSFVDAHRV